ncbi:hypothetical protein D1872_353480 [compost metagenome]
MANLCFGVFQQADVPRGQQQARGFIEGDRLDRDFHGQHFPAFVAPEHFLVVYATLDLQFGE